MPTTQSFSILVMMEGSKQTEAWMGLLRVRPLPGQTNPLDGISGIGWVLALATDEVDYLRLENAEMDNIGLCIVETSELARYSTFTSLDDHILDFRATVLRVARAVSYIPHDND